MVLEGIYRLSEKTLTPFMRPGLFSMPSPRVAPEDPAGTPVEPPAEAAPAPPTHDGARAAATKPRKQPRRG